MEIGDPRYDYRFIGYFSDGQGGAEQDPNGPLVSVSQDGGVVHDMLEFGNFQDGLPEMEVFSNQGARTFWIASEAPHTLPGPILGDPVGSRTQLSISQSFRKDEADASLSFTVTKAKLRGLDPSPAGDAPHVEAFLILQVSILDQLGHLQDTFIEYDELRGQGRANGGPGPCDPPCWTLYTEQFQLGVAVGGLDQGYVEVDLTAPFTHSMDLSDVGVGQEFTFDYTAVAEAHDTAQVDSGGAAIFRDPLDPDSGTYFEFTGLTPTNHPIVVPEPGRPLLVLAGAAVLGAVRVRRRHPRLVAG
jgi:hypothetical protein